MLWSTQPRKVGDCFAKLLWQSFSPTKCRSFMTMLLSCSTPALPSIWQLPGTQEVLSKYSSGLDTLSRPPGPLTSHQTGAPGSSASLRSSYDLPTSFLATSRHGRRDQLHCWYRASGFWFGFKDIKEKRPLILIYWKHSFGQSCTSHTALDGLGDKNAL